MKTEIALVPYSEAKHQDFVKRSFIDIQDIERTFLPVRRPGIEMIEEYYTQTIKEVKDNNGAIFIAEIDTKPVGMISFFPEQDTDVNLTAEANHYGYITDVYVVSEFRGMGVFQTLMAKATQYFKELGITSIRLNVVAKNDRARKAYEKEGFEVEELELRKKI